MVRSIIISAVVGGILIACGGSSVPVGDTGATDQKLQTTKNGTPTGDGTSCTWANTTLYDTYSKSTATVPTYVVGDEFKSIDGCNECSCSTKGIMCTLKTCAPKACDALAKLCSDGSSVSPTGPNCDFAPCPGEVACTDDAKKCPDGSYVGRTGAHCTFAPCGGGGGGACPALAKQCSDGSYVSPTGPDCSFPDCPGKGNTCTDLMVSAKSDLQAAVDRNLACESDGDCESVGFFASCVAGCTAVIAKAGVQDFNATKAKLESGTCQTFKNDGCAFAGSPCPAHLTIPRCVAKKCQE